MKLVKKRILAFIVDYLLIITCALLLVLIVTIIFPASDFTSDAYNPIKGQIIGFLSLTYPVFLYSFMTENSSKHATLGKRSQKLRVKTNPNTRRGSILRRNILKYLPWEIAHTGIHWLFYYNSLSLEIPIWVWGMLILPQITIIVYVVSLFYTKGSQSMYDINSQTRISYSPV